LPLKKAKIESLRKETEKLDFWKDQEKAKLVQKEIAELEKEIKAQSDFETEAQDLIELLDLMEKSRRPEGVGVPTEASGKTTRNFLKKFQKNSLRLKRGLKNTNLKFFLARNTTKITPL